MDVTEQKPCNPPVVPHVFDGDRCAFCGIPWPEWVGVGEGGPAIVGDLPGRQGRDDGSWLAHPDDSGRQGSLV